MPFFILDGVRFHYRSKGTGDHPFFFQHGLGGDVEQPFGLFQPPPGVRLLAFDCRGHGSTAPLGNPDRIGLRHFAEDLLAFMNHVKMRRAFIGGLSMGAAVALNFALRFPERVQGLVLSRPAWLDHPNPWNVRIFDLIAGLIRQHGPTRGLQVFLQSQEYSEVLRQFPETAQSLVRQFRNPRIEETVLCLGRIPRDKPCRDRLEWARIKVPTLVLANKLDPIHPFEYGEVLARAIPGAEFREIASKSVSVEQHGRDVQEFIGEFFRRQIGWLPTGQP
ncbi:MAG: alpha/beta hydrolase [Chloroflexi bacterium]|nr:alpha/beta hydrolase [Chloroflexota bacterium]